MDRAKQEKQPHEDKRNALEYAQRAGLYAQLELGEQRIAKQAGTNDKPGPTLRAKRPAEWIQGMPFNLATTGATDSGWCGVFP